MLPRSEVLEGLKVSLYPLGQVIDVAIMTEPNTGFFMGSGYAVIGTLKQSGEGIVSPFLQSTTSLLVCQNLDQKRINNLATQWNDIDSPQERWEQVKVTTRKIIKSYSVSYNSWREQTSRRLEKKRNRILRTKPPLAVKLQLISPLDTQIHKLQEEIAQIAILKSGIYWQENGETNIPFLKQMHQKRTLQQHMSGFRDLNGPQPDIVMSETTSMNRIAQDFYQRLYTPDTVAPADIDNYFGLVNFERKLDKGD
ncbi:hypothetical protein CU098_007626 [Rhizopus stolonifer]|uniref:Uncharacterized protein n=1 Tax=Rhizopus stolonifer TaxID=4846 RepID=A0A367JDV0_RHIST|nr:hypothetical protein CU098_007626 [Rhizopus stolonifer]